MGVRVRDTVIGEGLVRDEPSRNNLYGTKHYVLGEG